MERHLVYDTDDGAPTFIISKTHLQVVAFLEEVPLY